VKRWCAIVVIRSLVAAAAVVAAVSAPTRRVFLDGDFLAFESRDFFTSAMRNDDDVSPARPRPLKAAT
jgi:hypothetical protein